MDFKIKTKLEKILALPLAGSSFAFVINAISWLICRVTNFKTHHQWQKPISNKQYRLEKSSRNS